MVPDASPQVRKTMMLNKNQKKNRRALWIMSSLATCHIRPMLRQSTATVEDRAT